MHGGVMNMKGERQMIYKNVRFKADPFSYDLEFDDRITLVGGDSGTGKTVLYEMLEDIRLTDEYKAIKLFNYKSDNFLETIKQCRDSFIVVDNADCMINDDVRRFINFELSNQYMLFLRNCDGLNVSDKSFKVLKFDNNRITLEEVVNMCKAWDDHKKRGIQEGMQQGRLFEIYLSVQEGDYSAKRGAEKAEMSLDEFEKAMSKAGYKIPELV